MTRKPKRRPNWFRIIFLLILIGAALYVNQVVVPATPPLFVPTSTQTKSPESFVNQASDLFEEGKLTQAMESYKEAIRVNPENPSNYINLARIQVWMGEYEEAVMNTQNALLQNPNNPLIEMNSAIKQSEPSVVPFPMNCQPK